VAPGYQPYREELRPYDGAMSTQPPTSRSVSPIAPVYPFNEPGQPIVLHDGPVGGLAPDDAPGVVALSCVPNLNIVWRIGENSVLGGSSDPVTLVLRRPDGDAPVPGVWRGIDDGWSNGAAIGKADAPLKRIVTHWFNLPNFRGPITLTRTTEVGVSWWQGRWEMEVGGWKLTLDVRPDHARVWRNLHEAHVYVMTHVMEIRRADGAAFTAAEAEPLLTAMHVGVSFALGRWVAPILPVGEDSTGNIIWEDWRASHCDPARDISPGWWYEREHASLTDFLGRAIPAFADPDRLPALRLQMMLGIAATSDRGFVEQRVMMGAAGLEHIMWQTLVLEGEMSESQYRTQDAHEKLRRLLTEAQMPTDIDAGLLPITARFAAEEQRRQGKVLDGPDVVTQIRNRLVHPRGAQEGVYRLEGLVPEVWLLTRHYLVLLILHSLGYQASYRDLRKTGGWAGEVGNVPWK
jgi:hypothetical protein